MDYNELLERYFEGQTTLDEERLLREHFSSGGTPEGVMFRAFAAAGAGAECSDFVVSQPQRRRRWAIAAAAAAAIMIMVTAVMTQQNQTVYAYVNGKPVTDYDTAYTYTRDAMALLNKNLNRSMQYIVISD